MAISSAEAPFSSQMLPHHIQYEESVHLASLVSHVLMYHYLLSNLPNLSISPHNTRLADLSYAIQGRERGEVGEGGKLKTIWCHSSVV